MQNRPKNDVHEIKSTLLSLADEITEAFKKQRVTLAELHKLKEKLNVLTLAAMEDHPVRNKAMLNRIQSVLDTQINAELEKNPELKQAQKQKAVSDLQQVKEEIRSSFKPK